jgi:multiple sugar transport system substrate-binding protein
VQRLAGGFTILILFLSACGAAPTSAPPVPSSTPTQSPVEPVQVTVGVFGHEREIDAFNRNVGLYSQLSDTIQVSLRRFSGPEGVADALQNSTALPDIFMIDHTQLAEVMATGANQPIDRLLDERGVRFTDDFQRDAILAFSAAGRLQCMPYNASPEVLYVNTDLINLQRLLRDPEAGVPPERPYTWDLEQFQRGLVRAVKPREGIYGFWMSPTLGGMLPFVYGAGESAFDDDREPTSLALSNPDLLPPLRAVLDIVRRPRLAIPVQEKTAPLRLFKLGRLAVMPGYRDLVPQLREVDNLSFEVMPFPRNSRYATVAKFSALCMSADSEHISESADVLNALISQTAMSDVARQGYLVPSNTQVAVSDAFLQPLVQPAGAEIFNEVMRSVYLTPQEFDQLSMASAVDPLIAELFAPEEPDFEGIFAEVDEVSSSKFETATPEISTETSSSPER